MACLHPLYIQVGTKNFKSDVYGLNSSKLPFLFSPMSQSAAVVPCGKCVECLKRRQNSLAARCSSEAYKKGSLQFLTLTYEDSNLPISVRIERIDKETGEVLYDSPAEILSRDVYEKFYSCEVVRGELLSKKAGCLPRVLRRLFYEDEKSIFNFVYTPSLNREDFRLWLKSARVAYKRHFGVSLPNFSYACVGEYGPKTCRPHYHVAFFGLTFMQAQWLESRWQYGFTYLQKVDAVNRDGTKGYNFVARYLGKYLTKGKFDCRSVIDGFAEKGRLCCSKSLGFELDSDGNLPSELLHWYRCYDLFGEYDIDTLKFKDSVKCLSDEQVRTIIQTARKRCCVNIAGNFFPLPQSVIRKIWYVRTPSFFRPSKLRAMASHDSFCRFMDSYYGKLRQHIMDKNSESVREAVLPFTAFEKVDVVSAEESAELSFINSYSNSIF